MTWREHLSIHPSADVFPLFSKPALRELADDIKTNGGLHEGVTLYFDPTSEAEVLLDGRNRLDALELLGLEIFDGKGRVRKEWYGRTLLDGYDPVAYVIGANVRRRHLTKRQQADLIVAAVKAAKTDRAKPARSVGRNASGQVLGSSKDPVKEQVLAEAAKQGIGTRTATQALVDAEPERKRTKPTARKQAIGVMQDALFAALDSMAATLAATGHGAVTLKTIATFADGTKIERTIRG